MAEQKDVKVFISWSGDMSRAVALALRGWLPMLFDRVKPWASDTDIDAGQRGLTQIEQELQGTQFGIVVVTAANQAAPWLNFEAGAMSKSIEGDMERRVVPFLVDLSSPAQLIGPLSQFQAKTADREGALSLALSLGAVAGIDDGVVATRFEAYWGQLQQDLIRAKAAEIGTDARAAQPARDTSEVLDEILVHVRAMRSQQEPVAPLHPLDMGVREEVDPSYYFAKAAKASGLRILDYQETREGVPTKISVAPIEKYSKNDFVDFAKIVRHYSISRGFEVDVIEIPF